MFFAVNANNKSNIIKNDNLIKERKKLWIELKVQLLVKNERLLIESVRYVNFANC